MRNQSHRVRCVLHLIVVDTHPMSSRIAVVFFWLITVRRIRHCVTTLTLLIHSVDDYGACRIDIVPRAILFATERWFVPFLVVLEL